MIPHEADIALILLFIHGRSKSKQNNDISRKAQGANNRNPRGGTTRGGEHWGICPVVRGFAPDAPTEPNILYLS